MNKILLVALLYRWGDWVRGGWSSSSSVTQLGSGRPGILVQLDQAQVCSVQAHPKKLILQLSLRTDVGNLPSCLFLAPSIFYLFLWCLNLLNEKRKRVSLPSPHRIYWLLGFFSGLRFKWVWLGEFRFLNLKSDPTVLSWLYTDCNYLVLLSTIEAIYINASPKEYYTVL